MKALDSTYGLPPGTSITYGSKGFPQWVYDLGFAFGLKASTYPGHQEGHRAEAGFAPNPQRLNRGIDWVGSVDDMQRFAEYLLSIRGELEQVIWENPVNKKRVGVAGGSDVTSTPYYAQDYAGHRDHVHTRQSKPIPTPITTRPPFTEIPVWSGNHQSRRGTKVDLFLLHTQEGGNGDATALAKWMQGNVGVSYHYTVSTGRDAVTVCDVVDTDLASWSVLSANNRSINLCFAGSRAAWSRQQWLDNAVAIDTAAFLAVQDCRKYGIPFTVLAPPYTNGRAGISDHNYVSKVLGDGNHTDVGPNFPWDMFANAVSKHAGITVPKPPPIAPPTAPPGEGFLVALSEAEQREVLELLRQQSGYRRVSRSPLRRVGERETQTITGFSWSTDGSVHVLLVKMLAELGDPDALALLREVAGINVSQHPDRKHDKQLAQAILNSVSGYFPAGSAGSLGVTPGMVEESPLSVPVPAYTPPVHTPPAVPEQVYPGPEAPVETITVTYPASTGLVPGLGRDIGEAYNALHQLALASELPPEESAPLAALINVLQTKNGESTDKS